MSANLNTESFTYNENYESEGDEYKNYECENNKWTEDEYERYWDEAEKWADF